MSQHAEAIGCPLVEQVCYPYLILHVLQQAREYEMLVSLHMNKLPLIGEFASIVADKTNLSPLSIQPAVPRLIPCPETLQQVVIEVHGGNLEIEFCQSNRLKTMSGTQIGGNFVQ